MDDDDADWVDSVVAQMRTLKEQAPSAEAAWNELREVMRDDQKVDIGEMPTTDEGWGFSRTEIDTVAMTRIAFYHVFVGRIASRKDVT